MSKLTWFTSVNSSIKKSIRKPYRVNQLVNVLTYTTYYRYFPKVIQLTVQWYVRARYTYHYTLKSSTTAPCIIQAEKNEEIVPIRDV